MSRHTLTNSGFSPATVLAAAARDAGLRLKRFWQAVQNRKAVNGLADYDARMLKDIGLIQSDVAAALDQPWTADPSKHLTRVAAGRRGVRVTARSAGASLPRA